MSEYEAAAPTARRQINWAGHAERWALVAVWAVVCVVFSIMRPDTFATRDNFLVNIFGSESIKAILALAILVPLIAGDYDLTVAANLTLGAMIVAVLNVNHGVGLWTAALIALAVGAASGLVNGFLIVGLGIDSLIATLGTASVLTGVVKWVSDSQTITGIDERLSDWTLDRFLGLPYQFWYAVALCLVLWYVLEFTPIGRRLLFTGRSRSVARLSGLRVGRLRVAALVASGVIAAGAGILYAGTSGSAEPSSGLSFLLPAFAAAFLGATAIQPGRFNPIGALVAVYFLATGITGLQLIGAQTFVQDLFYGGALVIAVALSQLVRRREAASTGDG